MSQMGIGRGRKAAGERAKETAKKTIGGPNTKRFVLLPEGYCPEAPCSEVDRIAPALQNSSYALIRFDYDANGVNRFVEDIKARINAAKQAFIEAFELVIVIPLGYAKEFAEQAVKALTGLFDDFNLVIVQEGQA